MKFRDPPLFQGEILLEEELYTHFSIKTPLIEKVFETLQINDIELGEDRKMKVRLCLDEALMNAIMHGNKQNGQKKIYAKLMSDATRWFIEIGDEGEGFSLEDVPDIDNEESLMMESGRGVLLIESFTDEAFFYEGGRRIRMVYLR
jgi:serine/threonine-protein kinase RsbW